MPKSKKNQEILHFFSNSFLTIHRIVLYYVQSKTKGQAKNKNAENGKEVSMCNCCLDCFFYNDEDGGICDVDLDNPVEVDENHHCPRFELSEWAERERKKEPGEL